MTATLECADVAKKTTGEKQPKRYGVMVRVTDEFAAALRDATGVEHMSAAESSIRDPLLTKALLGEMQQECHELADYIAVAKRFHLEVNARSKDRVVSFGEKLSCRFMAALLRDRVRRPPSPRGKHVHHH